MFCNYAGVEGCTQPLDWQHQHHISMPLLADSTPPNRLPVAFHRMKSCLDATDRRVVDLRPSVAPIPEPPYGYSNFGGPEAAQRRQNTQLQTWSSRPYRDAEAYNQSRYNRSTVNHYSGCCMPPQNSFQPHGQQHQPSWDYQTAQTGYLHNCPPPYVAANPWQPPAIEPSYLEHARTKDTERYPSIPTLEEVQSLPTEAILDRLLATLAVFETRLETMDRRLDNLPLAQSEPDPPYVLRDYGLTELDPHRTAAANTLGPQPYSGYSVEMNGKSEISNIALLAKICEDQFVDHSGITGDDVAKNMDEEKDPVGVFSIEREDTTTGEKELGSTREEEIDFAEEDSEEEIYDVERDPAKDLQEHVEWLKVEQCMLIEETRSVELRAEELDITLMEMVKQDNRRQLSAKVEQMQRELYGLRSALVEQHEQVNARTRIPHDPPSMIFYGNNEGSRSTIRCAFDPGGDSLPKFLFATLVGVSCFPP